MAAILMTMLAVWPLLLCVPGIPVTRFLHAILVTAPAARLNRLTRGHLAVAVFLGIAVGIVAWAGEGDGLRMLAMASPEATTWLTTFEVAAYLDVAMAAIAAWSATRMRVQVVSSWWRRATPRRRRIARNDAQTRAVANDDEPADRRRCA